MPFHNQALDQFHETQINRGLKDVICRASYFRAVELCDFMAYLHSVVSSFCSTVIPNLFKRSIVNDSLQTSIVCKVVKNAFNNFNVTDKIELHNIFSSKAKGLDKATRTDLLRIQSEGQTRFLFICSSVCSSVSNRTSC